MTFGWRLLKIIMVSYQLAKNIARHILTITIHRYFLKIIIKNNFMMQTWMQTRLIEIIVETNPPFHCKGGAG